MLQVSLESVRISALGKYFFADFDKLKAEYEAKFGDEFFDLNVGDPVDGPPEPMLRKLHELIYEPRWHRYPPYEGTPNFLKAVILYYRQRYGVKLTEKNVMSILGIKEGIINSFLAFVNPGEYIIMTDPYFPAFPNGARIAQANVFFLKLRPENGYLPDLSEIPSNVLRHAKLMLLNYPNNPTGKVAPTEFIKEVVNFIRKHGIILLWDHAYQEIYYTEDPPSSPLQFADDDTPVLEFGSASKTFNAPGWRIGWAVGSSKLIRGLAKVKNNVDSGIFMPLQEAVAVGFNSCMDYVRRQRETYRERVNIILDTLKGLGIDVIEPEGSIFVLARVPHNFRDGEDYAKYLLSKGISVSPGTGYGETTRNFFRLSLTIPTDRLRLAMERFSRVGLHFRQET